MGVRLQAASNCRKCKKPLTIEEMHYYADEDGGATCNECEAQWSAEITEWRHGEREVMPEQ